jgi:hypothetical protein
MLAHWIPGWLRRHIPANGLRKPQRLLRPLLRFPQFIEDMRRRDQRHALLLRDQLGDRGRSFGRPAE